MSRGPDSAALLERALRRSAPAPVAVPSMQSSRWASATFAGERHELTLVTDRSPDTETWIGELPEAELPMRGHLVADLSVTRITRTEDRIEAVIEALTVEDR